MSIFERRIRMSTWYAWNGTVLFVTGWIIYGMFHHLWKYMDGWERFWLCVLWLNMELRLVAEMLAGYRKLLNKVYGYDRHTVSQG